MNRGSGPGFNPHLTYEWAFCDLSFFVLLFFPSFEVRWIERVGFLPEWDSLELQVLAGLIRWHELLEWAVSRIALERGSLFTLRLQLHVAIARPSLSLHVAVARPYPNLLSFLYPFLTILAQTEVGGGADGIG